MAWVISAFIVGAILIGIAVAGTTRRDRDLGAVSANWIAQHRSDPN